MRMIISTNQGQLTLSRLLSELKLRKEHCQMMKKVRNKLFHGSPGSISGYVDKNQLSDFYFEYPENHVKWSETVKVDGQKVIYKSEIIVNGKAGSMKHINAIIKDIIERCQAD